MKQSKIQEIHDFLLWNWECLTLEQAVAVISSRFNEYSRYSINDIIEAYKGIEQYYYDETDEKFEKKIRLYAQRFEYLSITKIIELRYKKMFVKCRITIYSTDKQNYEFSYEVYGLSSKKIFLEDFEQTVLEYIENNFTKTTNWLKFEN